LIVNKHIRAILFEEDSKKKTCSIMLEEKMFMKI
jgi:hypothetical protein